MIDALDKRITKSIRGQIFAGLAACTILVGGVGGVAAYTNISGAVIGSGNIIVDGRSKQVQHDEGGIVSEIFVFEGETVEAGQVLFELDGTAVKANLAIVDSQLRQLLSQEARLLAELAGDDEVVFATDRFPEGGDAERDQMMTGQQRLLQARRSGLEGRKSQLREQIGQLEEKISAINSQADALNHNIRFLSEQLADSETLHRKGLLAESSLIAIQRENASLEGSRAALHSQSIENRQAISEKRLALSQLDEDFREGVLTELDQRQAEIAAKTQERIALKQRLSRLQIRAPLAGSVQTLNVHTLGRVVSAGETLLVIVPDGEDLIVEAKLRPQDVDQISKGQTARIRLSGLDRRTTPELNVHIVAISPDATLDERTGASYYTARLDIPETELAQLPFRELKPGMPVEVFVETGSRSILSYLVKPIRDQIEHAMREE